MVMTENDAIRRLKDHFRVHDDGRPTPYLDEAVSMAIQALEKVQALEENKTYNLYREYLSIGTVSEFRELKEKATAKKPIVEEVCKANYSCKTYRCPTCKQKLVSKIDGSWCGGVLSRNCMFCGQKLDWSEGKE